MPQFSTRVREGTSIFGACFALAALACGSSACKDKQLSGKVVHDDHFNPQLRGKWRVPYARTQVA